MPIADSNPPIVVGDQANKQCNKNGDRWRRCRDEPAGRVCRADAVDRIRQQGYDRKQEDDCQTRKQYVQRDLIRSLLTFRAFHQRDHSIEEGLTGIRRDSNLDPIRDDPGAPGNRRPVAARLANDRSALAGDG